MLQAGCMGADIKPGTYSIDTPYGTVVYKDGQVSIISPEAKTGTGTTGVTAAGFNYSQIVTYGVIGLAGIIALSMLSKPQTARRTRSAPRKTTRRKTRKTTRRTRRKSRRGR